MAPEVGRKFKTKANRNLASSSSTSPLVDRVRFLSAKTKEVYETLTKYRSIWGEREIVLDEYLGIGCLCVMFLILLLLL